MNDLTAMAVFAAVVEAGGFTAAARRLGLSKSAVSKRVARLEADLGARLMNRTTRRLALTEVGEEYYAACARVVREAEAAALAVSHLQGEPRGLLKVSAPMSFGQRHLAPAIPAFLSAHPALRMDLDLNDRHIDLIAERHDMAIRIGRLPDSTLVARTLAPSRLATCAAPDYFARHGRPQRPQDLRDHDCLTYAYQETLDAWRFTAPRGAVDVRVTGSYRANNGEALLAALRAGTGIARMPTFIAGDDLRAGLIECCLDDYGAEPAAIHAVYPPGRHVPPKVRAFIDFLAQRFGPEPYWDRGL